ncbi:MAG: creatininase family protein [Bacillota bacterium]
MEVKEWLEKTDVVLVPVGSSEQHGPHLPIGIDSYAGLLRLYGSRSESGRAGGSFNSPGVQLFSHAAQ